MSFKIQNLADYLKTKSVERLPKDLGVAMRDELDRHVKPEKSGAAYLSPELRAAIKKGWKETWTLLYGEKFVYILGNHHIKAIKWHWTSRHRVLRFNSEEAQLETLVEAKAITREAFEKLLVKAKERNKPTYYADFPIFSRGHMKSTIARKVAVMDAVLSMYYGFGGYCLYFSGTNDKTTTHAISIDEILHSKAIRQHAPGLSEVKRADEGNGGKNGRSKGWKATFFYTSAGYVFHFGSLQSGLAGGNVDDLRPTMMIPDDIDDRKDSYVISENNFKRLTTEILPMGKQGTLTFWAQNLISRFSAMYRIYRGKARVLTNRRPSKPVPAIIGLDTVVKTIKGVVRDIIIAGTPTWKYFDLEACQDEINRIGLPAFKKECQHEVEDVHSGVMLYNYNDAVHAISESEFASVYGSVRAWKAWAKWIYHDWARTNTEFHANIAGFYTVSSQNARLPGFNYYFYPMTFPEESEPEDVAERILSTLSPIVPRTTSPENPNGRTWADLRLDTIRRANAPSHTKTQKDKIAFERNRIAEIIPNYSRPLLKEWNVRGGAMSHSEDTKRELYKKAYGIQLSPSNPGKHDSMDDINRDFKIDFNEEHPFRPGEKGYSRSFIVCPDDRTAKPRIVNGREVYPPAPFPDALQPQELTDSDRMRHQFVNWRTVEPKLTEAGEVDNPDPLKVDDDFGQGVQMLYHIKHLLNDKLPESELIEEHLPPNLQDAAIELIEDPDRKALTIQSKQLKIDAMQQEMRKPVKSFALKKLRRR